MGWGFFHHEYRPDVNTIPPSVRQELAKTGFRQTERVALARFETVESVGGVSENLTSEQKISLIDGLITEKRTRRRANNLSDEVAGLYVGPFAVIRFRRVRPPLVADLLPYQFWTSSRMSEFIVEVREGFPNTKGGNMRAQSYIRRSIRRWRARTNRGSSPAVPCRRNRRRNVDRRPLIWNGGSY